MSNTDTIVILIAFAAYLVLMIVIGAIYMKNTNNSEDYFLGGRGLSGWVAALSAQASDMSGWLLMGLPGTVYALGTGQSWIAIGLFLGTVCNWVFISSRLRKYTIRANNSLTLPAYFENRFRDKKGYCFWYLRLRSLSFSWYIQRLHCLPVENYLTPYSVWIIMWLWPSVLRLF